MGDFWDKNKGSITSGLKTAGKYGFQGTKYVAKTGYKAGKNFNNKNKKGNTKKDAEEDEDEEEGHATHGSYDIHYRDPSTLPPPPVRGAPGQAPQPLQQQPQYQQQPYQQQPNQQQPYQQQPYQQQPYQQQPYQQPPEQQPTYQQQPYQQPQYQQPQYQQPQYQQPSYQQQPYQQSQYQQPQNQLPAYQQQPPYQQSQYQQPELQAPQSQQLQQLPSRGAEAPPLSPTLAGNQPPQPPSRFSSHQAEQPAQGVPIPALAALPVRNFAAASDSITPNGSVPATPNSGIQVPAPAYGQTAVSNPVSSGDSTRPVYNRAGFPSPPLPSREAEMASATSTGAVSKSSVPGVTPYEYGSSEARKQASRLTLGPVDVTALPAPPTHKDRSTSDLPTSQTNSSIPTKGQGKHPSPSGDVEPIAAPTPSVPESDISSKAPVARSPVSTPTGQITRSIDSAPEEELHSSNGASVENTEETSCGIAGRFDYDVKVDYAPPPKPHRSVTSAGSKPSVTKRPTIMPQNGMSTGSLAAAAPPALPKRHSAKPIVTSDLIPATSDRTYEPPPKPFRRQEGLQSSQRSDPSPRPPLPPTRSSDSSHQANSLSSFPPPPVRKRLSTQSIDSRRNQEHGDLLSINPRGRLSTDFLQGEQQHHPSSGSINSLGKKKAPPPVVKPKPKGLSSRSSTSTENLENLENNVQEHANISGISAITEELAHVKLRKSGSTFIASDSNRKSDDSKQPNRKVIPPAVPRKKESLKQVPPVPMKATFPKTNAAVSSNPFELYLKDAVPSEEDRLHK